MSVASNVRSPAIKEVETVCALASECREAFIPLILDVGCLGLGQERGIYDRSFNLDTRSQIARDWAETGQSLMPLFSASPPNVYFSLGTYEGVETSTRFLNRFIKDNVRTPKILKADFFSQRRIRHLHGAEPFDTLLHDARTARRVWKNVRIGVLRQTLPAAFSSEVQQAYAGVLEQLRPFVEYAFNGRRTATPLYERLEQTIAGAAALAEVNAGRGVHVVTYNPMVHGVFAEVYDATRRSRLEFFPSRVVVSLLNRSSEPHSFYLGRNESDSFVSFD